MHLVLVARQPTCKGGGMGSVGRTREMLSSQPWCWIDHLDEARRGRLATLAASINGRGDDEGDLVRHGADRRHEWNTRWRIAGHSFYHLAAHVYDNWYMILNIQNTRTQYAIEHGSCFTPVLLLSHSPDASLAPFKGILKKYLGCQQLWSATEVWQTFEKYFWTNLTLLQGLSNTALCWLNHDWVSLCYLRGEAIISPSWFVREFWIEVDCRVGCYSLCPRDFKRCFRF